MKVEWRKQLRPGAALRDIVQQATEALVSMDADRLEELALCCVDLNREVENPEEWLVPVAHLLEEDEDLKKDMRLLERVLFETRANLTVFSRLQAIRVAKAEERTDCHAGYTTASVAASRFLGRKKHNGHN
jgi:hypothetical protein